ncbi:Uncharacterized protein BP5553_04592 [Venustampulla echinocandica]|uniref:Peptidase S1 domain-containing protein n=1 Tax=Venustampulla echinocandica TaxID=2656787 RepID=A0A370TNP9_9HELO|nr:Uncharacterized protein BP5553_04592 [Venustampulla echinocandica]RDL37159.1 Uncharacterized protein BP5553_04592 [Venustampulla echinocandica]
MKGLAVYVSSHPSDPSCLADPLMSTWTPIKTLSAIGASDLDAEFTPVFENNIHDNIVSSILTALPGGDWGLNVLRLGFDTKHLNNPITIHLVVAPNGGLSPDAACKIVSDILTIIAAAPDSSQLVHIDVCHPLESSSSLATISFSLLDRNPEVYHSSARLPYSSVGLVQSEYIGTLSGYIKHRDKDGRDTVYALTCRHVIDPHSAFRNACQATPAHLSVTCPAASDHNKTLETITTDIAIGARPSQREILEQTLQSAKEYNIAFGDVVATSGTGRLLPHFQGRSDWAIISITNQDIMAENKHVRSSDSFVSFKHPLVALLDVDFLRAATQYFTSGPHFKPVRDDDLSPGELVFKPRSRTTNKWTRGTFNAIRSTQRSAGIATREWCLVALLPHESMSAGGDSGSIIVDQEFRPIAMMWGGDTHGFAHGPKGVAYASPLSKVMRDIEECIGGIISIV